MNPLVSFVIMFQASLFSTGGMGNLPMIHDEYLPRGWATNQTFAESLAVGQLSPGPNGLWVVSLGYLTDGLRGSLLATLAIILPPFVILFIEGIYQYLENLRAMEGFVRGIMLSSMGIFAVIMVRLLTSQSVDGRGLAIVAGAIVLGSFKRMPVAVILILGAFAGMLLYS